MLVHIITKLRDSRFFQTKVKVGGGILELPTQEKF